MTVGYFSWQHTAATYQPQCRVASVFLNTVVFGGAYGCAVPEAYANLNPGLVGPGIKGFGLVSLTTNATHSTIARFWDDFTCHVTQPTASTHLGSSQLSILRLAVETFTARDGARCSLRIEIFAYPTCCIRRPR